LSWIVALLLAVGFGACVAKGANGPADPSLSSFPGFGKAGIEVVALADGSPVARRCALLAKTDAQRQRGLMKVTDLQGFAGMVFSFPRSVTETFYMKDTPMALTVAFFDSRGRFVSSADMKPCLESANCPTYAAANPYKTALEVPQGGLAALHVDSTTRLHVTAACPSR
jgi:uncharacterized membrane protein (UPF0127 family)